MVLKTVEIFLDPQDLKSVRAELMRHFKLFGHTPPPDLQEAANADMDRIMDNIITCLQFQGLVD
jgi:hypothetical protein